MTRGFNRFQQHRLTQSRHGKLLRHRTLTISLVSLPIYVAFALSTYFLHHAPIPASTSATAALITALSLLALYTAKSDSLAGHLFALALSVQVFGEMTVNGGMLAGATPMALLIAPIAIFTAGRQAAWPWVLVTTLALLVLFTLDLQGRLPENQFPPMAQRIDRVVSLIAGLMVMTLLVFVFDRQIEKAFLTLSSERADFKHSALHDELTGLPNRRFFYQKSEELLQGADNTGGTLILMFIDINLFKQINDQYGHAAGDAVLKEFAARLRKRVASDSMVARLSGDEFAIMFESITDKRWLEQQQRQLKQIVEEPCLLYTSPSPRDS